MSKVGFRREILGFNRQDVIDYIKKTQLESSLREKELTQTLDKLNKRNAELIDELKTIPELESKLKISEATVEKLAEKSRDLEEKREETEKVSQDIAKMYLVAKSNAENIKLASKESYDIAFYEIAQTLSAIEKIHDSLNKIRNEINQTSQSYSNDITLLASSLQNAKTTIENVAEQVNEISTKTTV